ncbi:MAG: phosphotransferase [Acidimicrobiales bacterium]
MRKVLGEHDLDGLAVDGGIELLRVNPAELALAVLHQRAPDTGPLLDEVDRLLWLANVPPAPEVIATGRSDGGDETVVLALGRDAVSAEHGHPMGPEALASSLATALSDLHARPAQHCPFTADAATLRRVVDQRIDAGAVTDVDDGPYAGRDAGSLAAIFDQLTADLGPPDDPVFIHAGLAAKRLWLDPAGGLTLLGWRWAGVGDRHLDLAAAAAMLTSLYGPALVGPFIESYGFDRVDLRRLDAHQILAHLLA